jgi:hypothetical protein
MGFCSWLFKTNLPQLLIGHKHWRSGENRFSDKKDRPIPADPFA